MYLTDRQLRERLDEFQFEAEDATYPFDPDQQVGPCSIDLRLSKIFWTPVRSRATPTSRGRVLDLDRTRAQELHPRRGWHFNEIGPHDKITIRPGHMVLARVAERFQMPSDCSGAIEGRSSYARLGLSVHSSGGFINPGWRGHMPLTLVNHSPVTIRIPVGTPLCQLLVAPLPTRPERTYAERSDRKYMNDTGGPSLWWRDDIMRRIQRDIANVSLDARAFDELEELFALTADEGVIGRLEDFIAGQGGRNYGNAEELLNGFARSEDKKVVRDRLLTYTGLSAWTVVLGLLAAVFTADFGRATRIGAILLTALSVAAFVWAVKVQIPYYLTKVELQKLRATRDRRRESELRE